jgi:CDP-glucose 4,6-dehydratase
MVKEDRDSFLTLRGAFVGQTVFLTGHTGFKGGWLALWLSRLGARVHGFALPPVTEPSLYHLASVRTNLESETLGDVRSYDALQRAIAEAKPRLVFHMAAQALVRPSYGDPLGTWSTNVMGTAHVLEAVRHCPSVRAVVVVTTDKCYENQEWLWGYRETDSLGGHDPYSSSKAGAELVVQSYRRSFFADQGPAIASARAGNVIGGGDWSENRLIPDAVRAVTRRQLLPIRSPHATRPWQHVLESLHGYLLLGAGLLRGQPDFATAFNFGPDALDNRSVAEVMTELKNCWDEVNWEAMPDPNAPHEANFLYLDSSKARRIIGWQPQWNLRRALTETAYWYQRVIADPSTAREACEHQLAIFEQGL